MKLRVEEAITLQQRTLEGMDLFAFWRICGRLEGRKFFDGGWPTMWLKGIARLARYQ